MLGNSQSQLIVYLFSFDRIEETCRLQIAIMSHVSTVSTFRLASSYCDSRKTEWQRDGEEEGEQERPKATVCIDANHREHPIYLYRKRL